MGFVHLHNHTEYSSLDGLIRHEDLAATAARLGQPAVAVTDHGFLGGAWKVAQAAKKYGIKPIIGEEIYLALGGDRTDPQTQHVFAGKPMCDVNLIACLTSSM